MLSQVWLKWAQWFWRRRICEKFTTTQTTTTTATTTTTDNEHILIRKTHLSLWLRWAKKNPNKTKKKWFINFGNLAKARPVCTIYLSLRTAAAAIQKQNNKQTRGPWATSLTWENKHIRLYHNIESEKKKNIINFTTILGSSFEQTWILVTQGCFVPSLVEIGPVVLEKKIF